MRPHFFYPSNYLPVVIILLLLTSCDAGDADPSVANDPQYAAESDRLCAGGGSSNYIVGNDPTRQVVSAFKVFRCPNSTEQGIECWLWRDQFRAVDGCSESASIGADLYTTQPDGNWGSVFPQFTDNWTIDVRPIELGCSGWYDPSDFAEMIWEVNINDRRFGVEGSGRHTIEYLISSCDRGLDWGPRWVSSTVDESHQPLLFPDGSDRLVHSRYQIVSYKFLSYADGTHQERPLDEVEFLYHQMGIDGTISGVAFVERGATR